MALQIRRGLQADLPASPADGELLYATDTNKLYVGDGGTAQEISGGTGGGLANVVEDLTPQLGGDLDINGKKIVSAGNGNIEIDPGGTGEIILHGNLNINLNGNITKTGQLNISPTTLTSFGNDTTLVDGNVTITRNSYAATPGTGFLFQQHHDTADAVNFTFFRSRGTALARTSVVNNDDIADISFISNDGTAGVGVGNITCQVDGVVSTGRIPGRFGFLLHDGITSGAGGLREVAQLNSAGTWKVNAIQNYGGTDLTLTATTVKIAGDVQINAQGDLRFADSDSSNYVAFQAPTTVTSNVTWTLPATDGTSGAVLSTDGSGALSWVTASGGAAALDELSDVVITGIPTNGQVLKYNGTNWVNDTDATGGAGTSLGSRGPVFGTSASLANGASGDIDITGFKGYILYKIQTSVASWVRLYTDSASRTADNSRLEGTDPLPGAGVIAEVITTGASTILISPGAFGFNNEGSPTTNIPVRVTNKSGSTTDVTVTLVVVQLEA